MADFGNEISVYSGNDDLILPVLSVGGKGVISVVSNLIHGEIQQICKDFMARKQERSRNMMLHYMKLVDAMFMDVNPVPIKEAMGLYGFGSGSVRAPLFCLDEEKKTVLTNLLKKYHIL